LTPKTSISKEEVDVPLKINLPEYYTGKGGPSQSIRKYIASAEGSHFAG